MKLILPFINFRTNRLSSVLCQCSFKSLKKDKSQLLKKLFSILLLSLFPPLFFLCQQCNQGLQNGTWSWPVINFGAEWTQNRAGRMWNGTLTGVHYGNFWALKSVYMGLARLLIWSAFKLKDFNIFFFSCRFITIMRKCTISFVCSWVHIKY